MRHKELFLGWEKGARLAYDGSQSRCYLDRDQQENNNPNVQPGTGPRLSMRKAGFKKAQSKERSNDPKGQMQHPHPGDRLGRLREQPGNRGESDEQDRHQQEQPGQESANLT